MFGNGAQFGMNGDNFSPVFIMAYNRSGATVQKGQVCMADILNTQSETSGSPPYTGNPNGAYFNLGPIVQATDTEGQPCYVAAETIADNALGKWVKCGECEVAICDDDVSTTDVDKGDRISVLVSQAAGGGALTTGGAEIQAWVTGGARTLGIALEDAAADSTTAARTVSATAHLRWCIWTGGIPLFGSTDT
jgi:hypothetical protein